MAESILNTKSKQFALEIIQLTRFLSESNKEFVLSKQLLRSGTAVGALIRESQFAESKKDFIHKLRIALKEANESIYWIELITESGFTIPANMSIHKEHATELLKLLISSINTTQKNLQENKK